MKACATCPNRWIAELAESTGDPDLAARIREAGCNNWRALQYDLTDQATGQPIGTEIREQCMRDHLPAWFNSVHAVATGCAKAAESHRNIVAEGLSLLVGRPVRGDGRTLPRGDRRALRLEPGEEVDG